MKPYCQGDFDSLCGLYAIINAIQLTLPSDRTLGQIEGQNLFTALVNELQVRNQIALGLNFGISQPELSRMLKQASIWLQRHRGLDLYYRKPFHCRPDVSISELLSMLQIHLNKSSTTALIGIDGEIDHWTVIQAISSKRLQIFDSSGGQHINLNSCSTQSTEVSRKKYQLIATSLFLIGCKKS